MRKKIILCAAAIVIALALCALLIRGIVSVAIRGAMTLVGGAADYGAVDTIPEATPLLSTEADYDAPDEEAQGPLEWTTSAPVESLPEDLADTAPDNVITDFDDGLGLD